MVWDGLSRDPKWSALAKRAAEEAGFKPARHPMSGEAFELGGDVSRCVQVFFQQVTFTEVAPTIWLGVNVEAFELQWRDRLALTDLSPEGESSLFGLNALNVKGLVPRPWVPKSPSDQEVADLRDYLGQAFEYAKQRLPFSLERLVAAIEADKIGDHAVWAWFGHPVKVWGFVQWLHRTHGIDVSAHVLPTLTDRTDPYDVQVMLGEP